MLPILQRRLHALEDSKASMLAQVRSMPASRSSERPGPGKWSAAELISHIARVEGGILQAVKQALTESERERVTISDRVGSLFVRNVLRSPLRVKVPTEVESVLPDSTLSAADAIADWDQARQQWCDLLTHVRGPELKGGVFRHPRGGWFTLPQTVLFLRLHHEHHRAQLGRITKFLAAAPQPVAARTTAGLTKR